VPGYLGSIESPERAAEIADEIGYPVMIKASAGGGGKGMRIAWTEVEVRDGFERARSEAKSSLGDDRVFIEKFVVEPRHIEIQVLADGHGNAIYLGERECSIQRRHQKIVEEAPSPAMTPELRARMGAAAVEAARAVRYRGAGTVEFIVDGSGNFYFLEMNTRLQVEHPVTEMTTGLDLVREQVRIAAGESLLLEQTALRQSGHSIECRIYAEVPEEGFRPATGTIEVFEPPSGPGVRLDTGIGRGSAVTYHFDPMLAKLIVQAPSRAAAIDRMKRALDDFVLLGARNNIDFLRRILASDDFAAGRLDTGFLERHPELFETPTPPVEAILAASLAVSGAKPERHPSGGAAFGDVWTAGDWRNT
jgi:propionyl-CoA carboxylase alpha chain